MVVDGVTEADIKAAAYTSEAAVEAAVEAAESILEAAVAAADVGAGVKSTLNRDVRFTGRRAVSGPVSCYKEAFHSFFVRKYKACYIRFFAQRNAKF